MNFLKGFTSNFCQALFAESDIKPKRLVGKESLTQKDVVAEARQQKELKEKQDNEARLERVTKDLEAKQKNLEVTYPGKNNEIGKTFVKLNENLATKTPFTEKLAMEFAAERREALQVLISSLEGDGRQELALASTPVKIDNKTGVLNHFLDDIAKKYTMPVKDLINFNTLYSKKFTVHTYPTNGKIQANVGKFYCDADDNVYVPKDKYDAVQSKVVETVTEAQDKAGLQTAETRYAARAEARNQTLATEDENTAQDILANQEKIKNRTCRLPSFLRTGLFKPFDSNQWNELLERSTPAERLGAGRIINVLRRPSFKNWDPNKFRDVIRRAMIGGKNRLSFRELSNELMGKNALGSGKFFRDYDALREEAMSYDPLIEAAKAKVGEVEKKEVESWNKDQKIQADPDKKTLLAQCSRQANETDQAWEQRVKALSSTSLASLKESFKAQNPRNSKESDAEWEVRLNKGWEANKPKEWEKVTYVTSMVLSGIAKIREERKDQTALQTKQNDAYTKREKMETLLADANALFDAMDAMVEGTVLKGQSDFEKALAENSALEVETEASTAETFYDYSSVVAGNPQKSAEGNTEAIRVNADVVDLVKELFKKMDSKISDTRLNLMDSAFVLNLLNSTYGMDQLVKKGYVKKTNDGKLVITMLPAQFNTGNSAFKKVFDSLSIETYEDDNNGYHSSLVFNKRTAETMKLATLKDQDVNTYSQTLLDSAFVPLDDSSEMTFADIAAGDSLIYLRTIGLLPKHMDPGAAKNNIISAHTSIDPETAKATVNYKEVNKDLEFYLKMGVETYFMDPRLDIVAELAKAGTAMTEPDAEKFNTAKEELIDWAKQASKADKEITKAHKKGNKKDEETAKNTFNECNKNILICKNRMLAVLKGGYLAKMNTNLQMKPGEALTDQQKLIIQNGYAVMEGMGPVTKEVLRKTDILKEYEGSPAVHQALTQIMAMDIKGELSSADLEEAAQHIVEAINQQSMNLNTQAKLEADLTAQITPDMPKELLFALAAKVKLAQTKDGIKFDGMLIGPGVSIPVGKKGWSVHLGLGVGVDSNGGITSAGGAAGIDKHWKVSDKVVITTSVSAGAGVTQQGLEFGAAASTVVSYDTGMVILAGGGAVGVGIKDGVPTLGWGAMGGIGYDDRQHIEEKRAQGGMQALGGYIDQQSNNGRDQVRKAELIAAIPEFGILNQQLSEPWIPPAAKQAMLIDFYETYRAEMENFGEANAHLYCPFMGVVGGIAGVLPWGGISLSFKGKTKIYPLTKNGNSLQELESAANRDSYAALRNATFGKPINAALDLGSIDVAFTEDGSLGVLPASSTEHTVTGASLVKQRFDSLNVEMKKSGMELTSGTGTEEGLLHLSIYNTENDEVEVIMDPTMKAALIAGDTPNDIYLATNMLYGNLIIQRQEFNLTRKKNESWVGYRKTVITIKSNPDKRRNANTFHQEDRGRENVAGRVEYRGNGKLQVDARYDKDGNPIGNTFTLDSYRKMKLNDTLPPLLKGIALTEEMLTEDLRATNAIIGRETNQSIDKLDSTRLAGFARGFYAGHVKLCRDATTRTLAEGLENPDQMNAHNTEMIKALQKSYKASYGTELPTGDRSLELSFILGVIRQETYVRTPERQKAAVARANAAFFEKVLTEEYGSVVANQLLANIDILNLQLQPERDITLPGTAQVTTVVGGSNVVGMRADFIGDGKLSSAIDYTDNPEMRLALLQRVYELEPKDKGILRTTMGLDLYAKYALIKGLNKKHILDKIYKHPELASVEPQKAVYKEFVSLIKQFEAATLSTDPLQQTVAIENDMGEMQIFMPKTRVVAGVLEYCGNPSTAVTSTIVQVNGDYANRVEMTQRGTYVVKTGITRFLAAGTASISKAPPPPETADPNLGNDQRPGAKPGIVPGTIVPRNADSSSPPINS